MKILDLLTQEVRASAEFNSGIQLGPNVILWTDKARQWEPALPLLQAAMPELIVFGDYEPAKRQGPAIWIKCVIENALPEFKLPSDKTPIIYLPGLERRDLRAIATCPISLMPLAELQYRGCWWTYGNGRDWTVNAFLTSSNGGTGLDVARDDRTQQAMLRVLNEILSSDVSELKNRHLEAADFNKLVSSDPVRDLLTWMNDSQAVRKQWDSAKWEALKGICETEFRFNPERDGDITAAELLCRKQGIWDSVWQRFIESPHHYPQLPNLLLKIEPDLAADVLSYPTVNKSEEATLESDFKKLLNKDPATIRETLLNLEAHHKERRDWIWSKLEMSPLANALEHLAKVARLTHTAFNGTTPEEMAEQYRNQYWQADDALLLSLASPMSPTQQELTQTLLNNIYTPWLDTTTTTFQNLVKAKGYPDIKDEREETKDYLSAGELVFFIDGLRFDISHRLLQQLSKLGDVSLRSSWAALPSVTATAKAAVTPVTDRITGRVTDVDFEPSLMDENKDFTSHYLKKYLSEKGWDYLNESETGDPKRNAWVQNGDIDSEGHLKGIKLAGRIDQLLKEVVDRIEELMAAGWKKIRIVTDHGWILTPSEMDKAELPKHLTETRWGRCAVLKESVNSGVLQVGWYWNPEVTIAMAPGARCFKAGQTYDHGGLSLQECLTPVIHLVSSKMCSSTSVQATLQDIRWMGLTCKVKAETNADGVIAVIRTHAGDENTEISKRKPLKDGKCSLMVEDDNHQNSSAVVVLLDDQNNVIAKKPTLIGEE